MSASTAASTSAAKAKKAKGPQPTTTTTAASTVPTPSPSPSPSPSPAMRPAELLASLQRRLAQAKAEKEANATQGKALDDKLARAFKTAPKRQPGGLTAAAIDEEMARLELRRSTTSMSLQDEKYILRELQLLRERKAQLAEAAQFQQWVDATKQEREERFARNRALQEQVAQLERAVKQAALAAAHGCDVAALETRTLAVPAERMGNVIGKAYANLRKLEADHGVLLDVDNKTNELSVTGPAAHVAAARAAVENIALATSHTIGLHPDTVKLLLAQKGRALQELEQRFGVKIDLNRADGVLAVLAAPARAQELQAALRELQHAVEVSVPADVVPKLIGKKGETIQQLMEDTGALIDIDKVTNAVRLCGAKDSVARAKAFVLALVEDQAQRDRSFRVDAPAAHDDGDGDDGEKEPPLFEPTLDFLAYKFDAFVEFLMANKQQQLKALRADAGDARIRVRKEDKAVHVTGNKAQLAASASALRARLRAFEALHWHVEVPDGFVLSQLIGKKGQTIKQIEDAAQVKVDIAGLHVTVVAASEDALADARARVEAIVAQNQRSVFLTSRHVIAVLLGAKRAKLSAIEKASGCKIQLPPPPSSSSSSAASHKSSSGGSDEQLKITLTGTLEAVAAAKDALEAVAEAHHVRYLPLDADEVPVVIGKKGETISELEAETGAKLKVLQPSSGDGEANGADGAASTRELEMIGTLEQLDAAQRRLDALLQTENRELLQLDAFTTGCLIGKKGERIRALRQAHPDASIDAYPARGQVRVKAASPAALRQCVDAVWTLLRETLVVETVRCDGGGGAASSSSFPALLASHAALEMRLHELAAQGGEAMKVAFQEDGRVAKIRGPALGLARVKGFLEMLAASERERHVAESIRLPTLELGAVLLARDSEHELNENARRICRATGCELRVRRAPDGRGGVVRVEGPTPRSVYDAKQQVEQVLQFYHSDSVAVLDTLPPRVVPRLLALAPTLSTATQRVELSLRDRSTLQVFGDCPATTQRVVLALREELERWRRQHVDVAIPSWLVPILVGKSGENIRKLSADSQNASLDLQDPSTPHEPDARAAAVPTAKATKKKKGRAVTSEQRVLTVHARDDAALQLAVANVRAFVAQHEHRTSTLRVPRAKLALALAVKKTLPKDVQLHVVTRGGQGQGGDDDEEDEDEAAAVASDGSVELVVYGAEHESREAVVEQLEHVVASSSVETIALPATAPASVVGALIGKSGANIRALQNEFPGVAIDIRRERRRITLTGPKDSVEQVKRIMEDKVEELVRQQEAYEERQRQQKQREDEERQRSRPPASAPRGEDKEDQAPNGQEPEPERMPAAAAPLGRHHVPVGASAASAAELKLTKNQRRRQRKRAENEKKSDVLSMLVGHEPAAAKDEKTEAASGYYHSTSGYKLRL
ncbi:hypothetical protein ATCC90586_005917 [Pythium insidiosum]|nr:hypothetical protein ATCC90586_005917 [Pythium insidiosum]